MDTEMTDQDLQREYGAAAKCTCQRCRQARRKAAEDARRTES